MDNKEAVKVIRSNWPDLKYSMLIEALELSIKSLEAAESTQIGAQYTHPAICAHLKVNRLCYLWGHRGKKVCACCEKARRDSGSDRHFEQ